MYRGVTGEQRAWVDEVRSFVYIDNPGGSGTWYSWDADAHMSAERYNVLTITCVRVFGPSGHALGAITVVCTEILECVRTIQTRAHALHGKEQLTAMELYHTLPLSRFEMV